jgi:hypothetical protein
MAYGDEAAQIAAIADYLCELDYADVKRLCGRHGVSLGMMFQKFTWENYPRFSKRLFVQAKLDEAATASIQQFYDFVRSSY